ncbi:C3HC zinc finger domain-containing protein [Microsporum canis CBS 113480]|uniref:C3HC zinc finger domain-containing protein n=1 Tax=Arthroderma otae (strain ATCC MYA-4605 / CBS 113480) TaxID=554155 RepID=C5FCT0_ARTOC|nr:C3HC zinc finger domain-containing protein [Microsporum canis CBS 113480]EEQ27614.1 C3HC zinc finger domain-containing protein [Microsporum canis CBS 113480]
MSYALASKKRKFHRVLDSISLGSSQKSSSPQPSLAGEDKLMLSGTAQINPSIKRVRLSRGENTDDSTPLPSRNTLSRHSTPSTTSLRPSFVPWDRERFLERLETFRNVERWKPQPDAINEVQWAKRGWSCTDKTRVECVGGCGQSVVVKLPDDIDELEEYDSEKIADRREVRAQLVIKYQNLIVEGHAEKCPWRKSGCDDSIQRLPLTKAETALHSLQTRYKNLLSAGSRLPSMETLILPEKFDQEFMLASLPPEILAGGGPAEIHTPADVPPSEETEDSSEKPLFTADKTALALALFGWDISGDANAGLSQSGRKLGQCGWETLGRVIESEHRRQIWSKNQALRAENPSPSPAEQTPEQLDEETRKTKDREWWAKLRRVRQILQPKGAKKTKPT